MITAPVFEDPDFQRKLSHIKSPQLDELIDEIQESLEQGYLQQCDQFPTAESLYSLNLSRAGIKQVLERLKTTNLNLNNEE